MENKISKQIEKGELFTLMVDATTDKSNYEIVSIVCRYIVGGTKEDDIEVVEQVVHIVEQIVRQKRYVILSHVLLKIWKYLWTVSLASVTMARLLCLANIVDYKRYSVSFVSDS